MRFKKPKERTELFPITATYPLELIHLDFLSIGGKEDNMKNVLVVTDHFTRYAQCYVMKNQTALTVANKLVNKYFTIYGWPDKILTDRGTVSKMNCFMKSARWQQSRNYELEAIDPKQMGNVRDLIKLF